MNRPILSASVIISVFLGMSTYSAETTPATEAVSKTYTCVLELRRDPSPNYSSVGDVEIAGRREVLAIDLAHALNRYIANIQYDVPGYEELTKTKNSRNEWEEESRYYVPGWGQFHHAALFSGQYQFVTIQASCEEGAQK